MGEGRAVPKEVEKKTIKANSERGPSRRDCELEIFDRCEIRGEKN